MDIKVFDEIKEWIGTLQADITRLKDENEMLRKILAVNKIDIAQEEFEINSRYDARLKEVLDESPYSYGLSVRTVNCLTAAKIRTFRELIMYPRTELMKMRNLGKKSIAEIDELLKFISIKTGTQLTFGMIPMSDAVRAERWFDSGKAWPIRWEEWAQMSEEERIDAYRKSL